MLATRGAAQGAPPQPRCDLHLVIDNQAVGADPVLFVDERLDKPEKTAPERLFQATEEGDSGVQVRQPLGREGHRCPPPPPSPSPLAHLTQLWNWTHWRILASD